MDIGVEPGFLHLDFTDKGRPLILRVPALEVAFPNAAMHAYFLTTDLTLLWNTELYSFRPLRWIVIDGVETIRNRSAWGDPVPVWIDGRTYTLPDEPVTGEVLMNIADEILRGWRVEPQSCHLQSYEYAGEIYVVAVTPLSGDNKTAKLITFRHTNALGFPQIAMVTRELTAE